MKKARHIDILPCPDKLFEGPNTHDLRFSLDGHNWHVITLTTKELRRLRRKIGVYLKTLESEYPNGGGC